MLRILFSVSAVLMLMASTLPAQQVQISGVVLDSVSQEPLIGLNIVVVGSQMGTSTDNDGGFTLDRLDPGIHQLRFSYVGFSSLRRIVVGSSGDSVRLLVLLSPEHIESEVIVVTGTRTLRSIADVPVRVEAIPEEEIEEKLQMTPSNVAMLLNESTGLRVQTTNAGTSSANLRIQGLSGRYTQILKDGIPSLGGLSAGFGLTQLVPLDLRQVEILKGATSSLYGADAIAGVVNFIPKLPGEISETSLLLNGTSQRGIDAAGFYSQRFEQTGISILSSHNRQARYDVDDDGFADVAGYERSTITPRLFYHFSDEFSARIGLSLLTERRVGGAMEDRSTELPNAPYQEKVNTNVLEASSHIDWQPSPGQAIAVKLAWLNSTREASSGVTPFEGIQTVYFGDAQYSIELQRHNLLVGSSMRLDDFQDRTRNVFPARSYRFIVPSIFVQDEFRGTDALTFLASGRVDFHEPFGIFLVPRFSVMYRPHPSLTLRLGGGTGYRAPTIFVEEAEEIGFRNVRALSNAKPEQARSATVDFNWRSILGSFTVDCNSVFFFTKVEDPLLADEDSLQTDVVYLQNSSGATTSLGGEFSLRLTYKAFKASLGYTYVYAAQESRGGSAEIDLNPRHSLGVVMVWEDHDHQLKLGFENYWTGSQRVHRNPFRTTTPPYWITGVIAEKGFGHFKLFLNLENIFDTRQTRYEPIVVGNPSTGNIRTLPIYAPLEGRVINAGIRYVLRETEPH